MKLDLVDEDCLSRILSLTSPVDACNVSVVSSVLRSSADSDKVWERILPDDYEEIVSRLVSPISYSSKKELFFCLCSPRLIDNGRKILSLDKSSGKKRYMLSARELSITWATNPLYWNWKPLLYSRFSEAVELRTICWLQIQVKFKTQMLSPKTFYGVYLIVKFADRAFGLDTLPSEVSLQVGDIKTQAKVYLHYKLGGSKHAMLERACFLNRMKATSSSRLGRNETMIDPVERGDGWIEIELGSFYNSGSDVKEVEACLKEVTGEHLKGGLIVEGIELRPK